MTRKLSALAICVALAISAGACSGSSDDTAKEKKDVTTTTEKSKGSGDDDTKSEPTAEALAFCGVLQENYNAFDTAPTDADGYAALDTALDSVAAAAPEDIADEVNTWANQMHDVVKRAEAGEGDFMTLFGEVSTSEEYTATVATLGDWTADNCPPPSGDTTTTTETP